MEIRSEEDAETRENASLITIAQTRLFVTTPNVRIHVNFQEFAGKTLIADRLVIKLPVNVKEMREVILRLAAYELNVAITTNVQAQDRALTLNVLILAHLRILVDRMPTA